MARKKGAGGKPGNPNMKAKKGEPGYFERNTSAASAAAAEASAIFPDAEEFADAVADYFEDCDAKGMLYGEAGLCVYLSGHNAKGRVVSVRILRGWHDGESCPHLQEVAQLAYLRIQQQIESDPRYQEKGMVTRSIFLQKQKRLGEYQDKVETKNDATFRFVFGSSMDESDFR